MIPSLETNSKYVPPKNQGLKDDFISFWEVRPFVNFQLLLMVQKSRSQPPFGCVKPWK